MPSNESEEILGLCRNALDMLGAKRKMSRRDLLSVVRRASVAELDGHVGPKW